MKTLAIFNHRCPKCGKGKFFSNPIYRLNKLLSMYENCESCNQKYEIEPGFFLRFYVCQLRFIYRFFGRYIFTFYSR